MAQRTALFGTTAVLIGLTGTAQADVTAKEVWDNLTGFYAAAGYDLQPGAVDEAAGSVTVTDLSLSLPNPYADLQEEVVIDASVDIPSMTFTEAGDGTVNVTFSEAYDLTVTVAPEGEEAAIIGLAFDQSGMSMVASGDPDMVTYDISGPGVTAVLDRIEAPGEAELSESFDATLALGEINGSYTIGSGDADTMAMQVEIANADLTVAGREPDGGEGRFDAKLTYAGLSLMAESVLAAGAAPGDLTAMLKAGLESSTKIAHSGATFMVDFQDRRDAFMLDGTTSGGEAVIEVGGTSMLYDISNTDLAMKMSGSEIPLPEVSLAAGATQFGVLLPVLASEEAEDVGIVIALEDLSISDMIWGMLDPGAVLPRDPATIVLDIAGQANWFLDIMDPEAQDSFDGGLPGALEALNLKELELSVAGASLTGTGDFTFNMDDLQTFDGIPAPTGALDLKLVGANGLIDKLIQMGLLPQDQAMMGRMMMGMFAKPIGEDELESKIEIDGATGAISANGQRLQ